MFLKFRVSPAFLFATLLLISPPVLAQEFPTKPVRIVVPSAPGVLLDTLARAIGTEMSKFLGQPVIVENKPGANQLIGYEFVARQAPADGYTIVIVNVPALATLPTSIKDLRFDPLREIVPYMTIGESRMLLGSSSTLPWTSFGDLVAYAKANPGKLNYGTSSLNGRLATEALVRGVGLDATHIPYPAAASYTSAVVNGEVHMGMVSDPTAVAFGNRFRVLAATGDQRRPPFLDVPTFAELGFPQIRGLTFSLATRAGTPQARVDKLRAAGLAALEQPILRDALANLRLERVADEPGASSKKLIDEASFFSDIAKRIGVKPE